MGYLKAPTIRRSMTISSSNNNKLAQIPPTKIPLPDIIPSVPIATHPPLTPTIETIPRLIIVNNHVCTHPSK